MATTGPDWVRHAIWWHMYPLGFRGVPRRAATRTRRTPARPHRRLAGPRGRTGHLGIALGPIFASRTHGYDTTDHYRIDPRLGDDTDFDRLVDEAHRRGLRVLLDGVFNHVGTDFDRYRQATEHGDAQSAKWFRGRPGHFHTFEGHGDLITLNHRNGEVVDYTVDVMSHWLSRGADGWRLDAAYAVPESFWAQVLPRVRAAHPDAWFVAEVIHGDYTAFVDGAKGRLGDPVRVVEGDLERAQRRQLPRTGLGAAAAQRLLARFAPLTFIGNHDVTRIASRLDRPEHLAHALVLLFTIGGVPSIYAGDEYGYRGIKGRPGRRRRCGAARVRFPAGRSRRRRQRRAAAAPVPDRSAPQASVAARRDHPRRAAGQPALRLRDPRR